MKIFVSCFNNRSRHCGLQEQSLLARLIHVRTSIKRLWNIPCWQVYRVLGRQFRLSYLSQTIWEIVSGGIEKPRFKEEIQISLSFNIVLHDVLTVTVCYLRLGIGDIYGDRLTTQSRWRKQIVLQPGRIVQLPTTLPTGDEYNKSVPPKRMTSGLLSKRIWTTFL